MCSMGAGRASYNAWRDQYFRSQHHVFLLLHDRLQARDEEITLVEKIHYTNSAVAICNPFRLLLSYLHIC
jgi:hypothetical protein